MRQLPEDDNHVYTYDVMNHQTAVYHKDMNQADHKGTIISQFYYGPGGERIGKEDYDAAGQPSSYTQYLRSGGAVLWEETWQLPAMDSASGKTYVYAGGKMAVVRESTQNTSGGWDQSFEYFATDHLGTVRFSYKVDGSGTFVASSTHDYEPFGLEIGPIETSDNTHRFTGHERDAETGNDYMHYRFYGANMGRFAKPDSNFDGAASNPQGWNLYSYVHGNPVNFNDPTGHNGSDPDNQLNKQKEHDKKQGVVRTDPAGDEEKSNVRKINGIQTANANKEAQEKVQKAVEAGAKITKHGLLHNILEKISKLLRTGKDVVKDAKDAKKELKEVDRDLKKGRTLNKDMASAGEGGLSDEELADPKAYNLRRARNAVSGGEAGAKAIGDGAKAVGDAASGGKVSKVGKVCNWIKRQWHRMTK